MGKLSRLLRRISHRKSLKTPNTSTSSPSSSAICSASSSSCGISHLKSLKSPSSSTSSASSGTSSASRSSFSSFSSSPSSLTSTHPETPQSICNSGMKIRAISYDSLTKLSGCIDNMNEDVGKILLTSDRDLRKDPTLFSLVNDFFNTNTELSDLCESLKICLEKVERGETFVQDVLSDFVKAKKEFGGETSFRKTREHLRGFKSFSVDDPFAGDFTKLFRRCHGDLVKMIDKLNQTAKNLDKKLRRIRRRRRVSISLFLAAVATVVASAVVVGLMAAPPVVAALGGIVSFLPVGTLGVIVSSLWQKSQCLLKRQKAAISSMERGICVALSEVAKISLLVNKLEDLMRSMGETMDAAAEKKSPINMAMGGVEKELLSYHKAINDLRQVAGRCDEETRLSRDVTCEKMKEYLTRYEKPSTLKMIVSAIAR